MFGLKIDTYDPLSMFLQGGCAVALLLTLINQTSRIIVYIGTGALGLFLSSMSPTAMALTEQFIDVNGNSILA